MWGINGILILIFVLFVLFNLINESYPNLLHGSIKKYDTGIIVGKNVNIASDLNFNLQHLMYDSPQKIKNSDYYYSEIVVLDKQIPESIKKALQEANDISSSLIGATINIVFFNELRTDVHKLLDKFAYVKRIDAPRDSQWDYDLKGYSQKTQRNFIVYELGFKDTNKDGRINECDSTAFFISNLNGKNLKQITPSNIIFKDYSFSEKYNEIYFERIEESESKDILGYGLKSRNLFYYNINAAKFGKFDKFDEILDDMSREFYNFR